MIPPGIITANNPTGVKSASKKISTEKIIQSGFISLSIENKRVCEYSIVPEGDFMPEPIPILRTRFRKNQY